MRKPVDALLVLAGAAGDGIALEGTRASSEPKLRVELPRES